MPLRMSGLSSGMDTESIIQDLVKVKSAKVDAAKKAQTRLGWKQDAWKELNSKMYKLFNGAMNNLNYYSSYAKRTTDVSNSSAVNIITGENAMKGTQTLKIKHLAKGGFLTGGQLSSADGSKLTSSSKVTDALGIASGSKFAITANGKTSEISVSASTTVGDVVKGLQAAGVDASFDEKNQRFYVSSKELGAANDFSITASNAAGTAALDKLGILVYDTATMAEYTRYAAMDTDGTKKQAEIDKGVASRLSSYKTQKDNLTKELEGYKKTKKTLEDEYRGVYQEELSTVNRDDLQAQITTLKDKPDLTEAEKAELKKLQAKMSYVDGYKNTNTSIARTETSINDIGTYMNADGTATASLISNVTSQVETKIAVAVDVINNAGSLVGSDAHKIAAQDAEIMLNGATYKGDSNTFEINGLTINCLDETGEQGITVTTRDDNSGVYDMIKGFLKEYNALIIDMDKLYNAETAKGYEPLTDEEKEALSESEVEKWEGKIKDSLLRRDETLGTVFSSMKTIMSSGFEVNGKKMYLSDFGIETLGYFNAAENEKNVYHINGDKEDSTVASKSNDLMAMISSDPDTVAEFFTQLTKSLYGKTQELMKGTEYSSSFCLYEDKKMKEEYTDYTVKIKELEDKLKDYEDKWYSKFAAMETALARLQSNASAVTSLLGG